MIHHLATDPRFLSLGDRKAVALELLVKEVEGILSGDESHPSRWLRIIDICRQEAGIAPMNIWSNEA